jgi:transcriptional regulator with XRE-family HTH domain
MTLHEKLKRLTRLVNLAALSRDVGVSQTAIWQWVAGKKTPRVESVTPLARALRVEVSWLIDDSQDWPPVRIPDPDSAEVTAVA